MMEKLSQIKTKIFNFNFLLKQPVAFRATTLSPCRSPTYNVSIIPKEARRKYRGGNFSATREPSSPKVSCLGQVQGKKKKKKKRSTQKCKKVQQPPMKSNDPVPIRCNEKKILLWISKGSDEGRNQSGKALILEEKAPVPPTIKAPSLGMMNKFASGRGSLYDFDITLTER